MKYYRVVLFPEPRLGIHQGKPGEKLFAGLDQAKDVCAPILARRTGDARRAPIEEWELLTRESDVLLRTGFIDALRRVAWRKT